MENCSRCLLPASAPNIAFDSQGVCNYCHKHQPITYPGEMALKELLKPFRQDKGKHQCAVTLSGGRDSSFTLLKVAKDFGMKTLAINFESPFMHPQARINVENATKALHVDLIRIRPKPGSFEGSFRNNLVAWLKKPSIQLIPMFCIACRLMEIDFFRIARHRGIRCIITGSGPLQSASFIYELSGLPQDVPFYHAIARTAPRMLGKILQCPGYLHPKYLSTTVKSFAAAVVNIIGTERFGISQFGLPSYIPWKEQEALSRIRTELGWNSPKEIKSTQRFDCPIGYLKNYIYFSTIGITKLNDFYAKELREGMISREEAEVRIKEENVFDLNELRSIFSKIRVPFEQLASAIEKLRGQMKPAIG